ncbi:MAG: hypothetical protein DMF72_16300 [Acidobacteria bacterium]|nr:MAG: hypothetical protein DMF72_16300 [Acidobacteriota bacterium]
MILESKRLQMTRHLRIANIAVMLVAALTTVPCMLSGAQARQEQIAGGYSETANSDPDALAAARFAIKNEAQKLRALVSLRSIKRAEVQVVAGLNYRLCMTVRIKRKTQLVTAVVYKNLKQKYSLTSWTAGCEKP